MSIYSYHTFILPFVWECQAYKHLDMSEFVSCFDGNPNWICTDIESEDSICKTADVFEKSDILLYYSEYQYFHPFVRNAMYGFGKGIVKNYSFMPQKVRNKGHYYIEKRFRVEGKTTERKYDLLINAIKLKVFNTGIALFIMECENHGVGADGSRQDNFDDAKNINDFGRRITLPYIPQKNADYISICADRLTVDIDGVGKFVDDNLEYCKKTDNCDDIVGEISLTHMCDYVKQILEFGGRKHFTSKKTYDRDEIYIYPALDDRMFVASCIIDKDVVEKMAEKDGDSYKYLTDETLQKQLYEYAFADPGYDGCTCRSESKRVELLKDHVYDRWVEYGTIDCISAQAFVRLLKNGDEPSYYEPFLTQYVQMTCLCLADRATLIHFQREASALSEKIEKRGKKISHKTVAALMNFQERFVAYQSQLSFTEVTPQEQGIELYGMLQKFMFIKQETETLQNRIDNLENAAETSLDYGFNRLALVFAVISVILALSQNIVAFINSESGKFWAFDNLLGGGTFISMLAGSALAFIGIMVIYRRRK